MAERNLRKRVIWRKKVMESEAILGKSLWNESQLSLKPSGSKGGMFSVLYSKRLSTSIRRLCLLLFQRQWVFSPLFFHLPTKEVGEHLPTHHIKSEDLMWCVSFFCKISAIPNRRKAGDCKFVSLGL